MGEMASQITNLPIVYSTVNSNDNMADILQTMISNSFLSMTIAYAKVK